MRDLPRRPSEPGARTPGGAFGALRHRDYGLLWSGSMLSQVSNWMQQIAQQWLIYELTGSALLVGLNGLVRTIPFLGMSLYAGTVVDRVDRRKLMAWVALAQLLITLGQAMLIGTNHIQVVH